MRWQSKVLLVSTVLNRLEIPFVLATPLYTHTTPLPLLVYGHRQRPPTHHPAMFLTFSLHNASLHWERRHIICKLPVAIVTRMQCWMGGVLNALFKLYCHCKINVKKALWERHIIRTLVAKGWHCKLTIESCWHTRIFGFMRNEKCYVIAMWKHCISKTSTFHEQQKKNILALCWCISPRILKSTSVIYFI